MPYEDDLMCVVGWSPTGIDYGAPDGEPVSMVVMYLVPENQRNHYLREISMLAKALETYPRLDKLRGAGNLNDVRNYLLDLIEATKETVGPDARARMIRLQTKVALQEVPFHDLESARGARHPDRRSRHEARRARAERGPGPVARRRAGVLIKLETDGVYQNGGWRLVRRTAVLTRGAGWSTTAWRSG